MTVFIHIKINNCINFSAVDVDIKNKRIYWADIKMRTINRVFLNGSMPERLITFGLQSPEGIFLLIL